MLDLARIEDGNSVLEPSAGSGDIADAVTAAHKVNLHCSECNHTLRRILVAKGYDVGADDFLSYIAPHTYDRVVMNPPFERQQDIDHVRRAFGMLLPGGRLVSVMSPSPFFTNNKKAIAFREWFNSLGVEKIDIPAGAFKESGTNIASCLIVIDKE